MRVQHLFPAIARKPPDTSMVGMVSQLLARKREDLRWKDGWVIGVGHHDIKRVFGEIFYICFPACDNQYDAALIEDFDVPTAAWALASEGGVDPNEAPHFTEIRE